MDVGLIGVLAYCFDRRSLWENQRDAYTMKDWMTLVLGRGLTGEPITFEQLPDWLRAHYRAGKVQWFTNYQTVWNQATIFLRLPDRPMTSLRWVHDFYGGVPDWEHTVPGMPFFYILGFVGMGVSLFRPTGLRPLHFAWVATILGGLYVASLAGVTNGRFRFIYEPFFLIYLSLLFDGVADFIKAARARREAASACST